MELRRETFDSGRRTRRTNFLPLYGKGTKFPNYCRLNKDEGTRNWEAKREREESVTRERQQQEKEFWKEKFRAKLRVTEQKLEIETAAKAIHAKLPKLRITPFKGTSSDWVRFENNMFKGREKISNLNPGTLGYKTAWERLQKEYGQTKLVVNAHMDEIINLTPVKGSSFEKVREFYEVLSKNYDALQTLGEADMLRGFVMTTLKKLP